MAKPKDTMDLTNSTDQQGDYLEKLKNSPLFHLSAGSKELFHSNFLYWLAINHWDVFIRVMRNLAGRKENGQFWWENSYTFKDGNLEIRRESKHFDLAIFICTRKKWRPVLILENKVKSLPNAEQLKEYKDKAEKEWDAKENKDERITFILLSLTDAGKLCKNPELKKSWSFKKYDDLVESLESNLKSNLSRLTDFHKQLFEDYYCFIRALCGLAESWMIRTSNLYLARLCPATLRTEKDARFKREYDNYKILDDLRLNDVWQKVSFEKLRFLLEEELSREGIHPQHFCRNKSGETPGFYMNTGYTRDTGLIELRYVLESHKFANEPVCVLIQIQGNQYRYAVTADKIIVTKKITPTWDCLNGKVDRTTKKKIEDWVTSKPMHGKSEWCHFGDSFIHRYRHIKSSETVKNVIDDVVKDAKDILKRFEVSCTESNKA